MSSVMTAFLPTPGAPILSGRGTRGAQICSRRPAPSRQPARVYVSAAIDEAPPNDSIPVPRPPPQRPQPNAPPQRAAPTPYIYRGERPRPSGDYRGAPRPAFIPDPTATYFTKCGSCQAAYKLDPDFPGPRGKKVACSVCGNQWFQRADRLMTLRQGDQFKEYPVDQKDELMEKQQQLRMERFRARSNDGGDRRGGYRRDGPREGQGARRSNSRNFSPHSLFIGNLPFNTEQEDLERVVGQVVEFTRVAIIRDPTGRSKGFAFADVKSEEAVQMAVSKLDGKELGGRAITVREGRKN